MMRPEWGRRSGRLKGFDYTTPGLYFVTICTRERAGVLGDLHAGSIVLSPIGEIVRQTWAEIPGHFPNVDLDEYVVMPNHLHGLLCIVDVTVGAQHPAPAVLGRCAAPLRQPPQRPTRPRVIPGSLGAIVRTFKSASTRRANLRSGTPGASFWQRNYYEHVIRDEEGLNHVRAYIKENPLRWSLDKENPALS